MLIRDGIAHANDVKPIKAIEVRPCDGHKLWIRFNTGEEKVFDFSDFLNTPAFAPLKDADAFRSVSIDHGVPEWMGGDIDIDPIYLYEHGVSM